MYVSGNSTQTSGCKGLNVDRNVIYINWINNDNYFEPIDKLLDETDDERAERCHEK